MRPPAFLRPMLFKDRAIIRLDSVDSTNDYASNLVKHLAPTEGTVVTAQEQVGGKGQRGTMWESELNENLLCSIILFPTYLSHANYFYLTKVVALALRELVEEHTEKEVYIKWPNDIIVNNKKIAGILIETIWNDQKMQSAVVGIGLNVHQTKFENNKATSIKILNPKLGDVEECLKGLLNYLDKYLLLLQSGQYTTIARLYREHLFKLGQVSKFIYHDMELDAMITGVDEAGRLRLYTDNGESLNCGLKEIRFVF